MTRPVRSEHAVDWQSRCDGLALGGLEPSRRRQTPPPLHYTPRPPANHFHRTTQCPPPAAPPSPKPALPEADARRRTSRRASVFVRHRRRPAAARRLRVAAGRRRRRARRGGRADPPTTAPGHRLLGAACDDARAAGARAVHEARGVHGRCEVCERMLAFCTRTAAAAACRRPLRPRPEAQVDARLLGRVHRHAARQPLVEQPADEYRLQDCAQIRNVRKTCELWNFC